VPAKTLASFQLVDSGFPQTSTFGCESLVKSFTGHCLDQLYRGHHKATSCRCDSSPFHLEDTELFEVFL